MGMFYWKCLKCEHTGKKLAPTMPEIGQCPDCGSDQDFVDESSSRIIEVRDNGLMHKKVEQLAGINDLMRERSTKAKNPDKV